MKTPDDDVMAAPSPTNPAVWQVRRWLPAEGWGLVVSEHDNEEDANAAADTLRTQLAEGMARVLGRHDE